MAITLNVEAYQWAAERSGISREDLDKKFSEFLKLDEDDVRLTYDQIAKIAKTVNVPLASLLIPPPNESELIPDLRTIGGKRPKRMSPNLIDMIYICQNRQAWYREYCINNKIDELDFVGSSKIDMPEKETASVIRETIKFDMATQLESKKIDEAKKILVKKIEKIGVLVMISKVVGNSTRQLDDKEFRGFALSDSYAPVIFVNGNDNDAAQIFTLAHELAHIWLDSSGLTNMGYRVKKNSSPEEVWCNSVAAQLLVPESELRNQYDDGENIRSAVSRLAKAFSVSRLVILLRLSDTRLISENTFRSEWKFVNSNSSKDNNKKKESKGGGGNIFYYSLTNKVGERFGNAIVSSTLDGKTLYRDAYRLLGVSSDDILKKFGRHLKEIK